MNDTTTANGGENEDEPDFEDLLAEWLDFFDRELAKDDVNLRERPLRAANDFARWAIKAIGEGDEVTVPGKFADNVDKEWFKLLYARTVAWYRERYGAAMDDRPDKTITGCVLALGTPFRVDVPLVVKRPGKPGETIWICFPDEVESDEDVLDWIVSSPNIMSLPRSDGMKTRRLATEVSNALRAVHIGLMTVEISSSRVGEFRDPIKSHLEHAAEMIVRGKPEDLKHAQWDLQMACELSLKMLSVQRSGSFTETHDLWCLFDRLPGDPPFKREFLHNMPAWERMAKWRYGGGPPITVADAFSRYRTALKIVAAVTTACERKYRIGGGRFEIRRAPFLHEDPDMFLPRSVLAARQAADDEAARPA